MILKKSNFLIKKPVLFFILLVNLFLMPLFSFAQSTVPLDKLQGVREASGYAEATGDNLVNNIGVVINAFLSLLGIIFIILMLYAGYNWMIAAGDEAKVTKAKDTIQRAIIGLIITVGSFAIWNFIFTKLI